MLRKIRNYVKALQTEYSELISEKTYTKYHAARKEMQNVPTANTNVIVF